MKKTNRHRLLMVLASMLMFAGLGVVGVVFALLLKFSDQRSGTVLDARAKASA